MVPCYSLFVLTNFSRGHPFSGAAVPFAAPFHEHPWIRVDFHFVLSGRMENRDRRPRSSIFECQANGSSLNCHLESGGLWPLGDLCVKPGHLTEVKTAGVRLNSKGAITFIEYFRVFCRHDLYLIRATGLYRGRNCPVVASVILCLLGNPLIVLA